MKKPSDEMEKIRAKITARALAARAEMAALDGVVNGREVALQKSLPFWPELERGIPNAVLRSALFGTGAERRFVHGEEIATIAGYKILQTGETMNQYDLTTWMTVLHMAIDVPLGDTFVTTGYELLQMLDMTDTGPNYATLKERLMRLKDTRIEVNGNGKFYAGNLIDSVTRIERTDKYKIRFNPEIHVLFGDNLYTRINWDIRQALKGKPLAMWNHAYFSSHTQPFPITIVKLHEICGSEIKLLKNFKPQLIKALDHVVRAYEANGQVFSYIIEEDSVKVVHSGSASQRRHLARSVKSKKLNTQLKAVQGSFKLLN
jgi:hypothetical protein